LDFVFVELMDVIVCIDIIMICGTDLYILKGDVLEVEFGMIFGYEVVGIVVEVGVVVIMIEFGDCVFVLCIMFCGCCQFCKGG